MTTGGQPTGLPALHVCFCCRVRVWSHASMTDKTLRFRPYAVTSDSGDPDRTHIH